MRFARMGPRGREIPVVESVGTGAWHDLRPITSDIDADFLESGIERARSGLASGNLPAVAAGRFGVPVAGVGKIICIGLNYRDHAAETGAAIPTEPIVFLKTPDTLVGASDDVFIPRGSTKTDYEVELAVVIGRTARYLDSPDDSDACIAGFAVSNDVSEREFQLERGGQWDKGKNCETFNPLGPVLVTTDEVADPHALGLRLWVNGELRQDGNTEQTIFDVDHLVWYLSQFMVLRPGDVINTGTPAGVALGRAGELYLRAGDVVRLEIDGLGQQSQTMKQA